MFLSYNLLLFFLVTFCCKAAYSKKSKYAEAKRKYVFEVFLDFDKSGDIDSKDFDVMAERFGKFRGWQISNPKYQQLIKDIKQFRDGMFNDIDPNHTGRISEVQWVDSWEEFGQESSQHKWHEDFQRFGFDFTDSNANGFITEDEFVPIFVDFGTPEVEVKEAYKKACADKDSIDLKHFKKLWGEYYTSDDPNAAGNFIVGKLKYE